MENYTIVFTGNSCETCGQYNYCKRRTEFTAMPSGCSDWVPIPDYIGAVKSDGTQIHRCPHCGHRYWD